MGWQIKPKIVRKVATIDENRSTLEAAVLMTEKFIGAVVVTKGQSGGYRQSLFGSDEGPKMSTPLGLY